MKAKPIEREACDRKNFLVARDKASLDAFNEEDSYKARLIMKAVFDLFMVPVEWVKDFLTAEDDEFRGILADIIVGSDSINEEDKEKAKRYLKEKKGEKE